MFLSELVCVGSCDVWRLVSGCLCVEQAVVTGLLSCRSCASLPARVSVTALETFGCLSAQMCLRV